MQEPRVILVDENDKEIGTAGKLDAHKNPRLHRAFSIFIFNSRGELLIQQRASTKYHCPDLWSNTCCSHPQPNQTLQQATHLRLREEMGFDTDLKEIGACIYEAHFDNGLTESEYDHIFIGKWNGNPQVNPQEVADYMWISLKQLVNQMNHNPAKFTIWLQIVMKKYLTSFDAVLKL